MRVIVAYPSTSAATSILLNLGSKPALLDQRCTDRLACAFLG